MKPIIVHQCGAGFQPAGRFLIGPIPGAYSYAAPRGTTAHLRRKDVSVPPPGQEAAGTIEAIGEGATRAAPSDRVACTPVPGAYTSYSAPHSVAIHLSHKEVAAPKPGQKAAGTIKAIGEHVTRVAPSNRVTYTSVSGAVNTAAVHLRQKVHS